MPLFQASLVLPREPAAVLDWFIQPAWMLRTAPPELALRLVEGPERLFLGARVVIAGRRWGVPHRATMEVTGFEPPAHLVEEQRQGSFRRLTVTHRFEPAEGGTLLTARVEFEPPGGILGLTVTEALVRRELQWVFDYRAERLREADA
jgi:ligand-binding SRPBCC domain-containing protein